MNSLGELITQLMDKGWTKQAIADELQVNWRTIHRWVSGEVTPRPWTAITRQGQLEALLERKQIPLKKRYNGFRGRYTTDPGRAGAG